MMKRLNKMYAAGALLIALMSTSGCSFLDKEYDASLSEEKVFNNTALTRSFLTNIYTNLPDGFGIYNDPQFLGASRDCMTDNATSFWGLHFYNKINTNSYTSTNHPLLGFWGGNFSAIRKCNQFLHNVKDNVISNSEVPGDDNKLYERYRAEAIFLRALFHFELVAYFGDAPILCDRNRAEGVNPVTHLDYGIILDMDEQAAMNLTRSDAAEVLLWIAEQCDYVKDILPFRYASEGNWGRINGAAAYALKSRALLYRASVLHNPSNDKTWWAEAAQGAKDFMDKNQLQTTPYQLYPDYQKCFYEIPYQNEEIILSRSIWYTSMIETSLLPESFSGCAGRTNPTQNFVDCFEMSNGKRIDEAGSGYSDQNPYENRDPRFAATIFHHGSEWGREDYNERHTIDVHFNSASDKGPDYRGSVGGTFTGYYLKKFVNPDLVMKEKQGQPHAWVIYRYAEILMNYAEAKAEADGRPSVEALDAVNQIRTRANMPPYTVDVVPTLEEFRRRLRNERRVEFSFEDHRYFDVRRWKLYDGVTAENELTKPRYEQLLNMYGVEVRISGSRVRYTYAPNSNLEVRSYMTPKNHFFPIPFNEIQKAPNLGQNPGW